MASRVAQPNNFKYTPRPPVPALVPLVLPGTWLLVIGGLNVFYAISVLAHSHIFITTASWLTGDARPAGWLWLVIGLVQLAAVPGVFLRRMGALWIGILSAAAHIVFSIMFMSDELVLGILLLGLDLFVLAGFVAGATRLRADLAAA